MMKQSNSILIRTPIVGITLFAGLYIYSSSLYPGGSQANLNTIGFDWVNNYWCNLMNENAMNEEVNPARPFAILAMIILCFSLAVFFIHFAKTFSKNKIWKKTIQVSGILSMVFAALIFTQYRDAMTIVSSVFGLFVVIGIVRELYLSEMVLFKLSGVICLLLLALNNYIYYTTHALSILPLLQKITFAIVLLWIVGLNYKIILTKKKELKS